MSKLGGKPGTDNPDKRKFGSVKTFGGGGTSQLDADDKRRLSSILTVRAAPPRPRELDEIPLKTVLSKSEHLAKITLWEAAMQDNLDSTDFETATSVLVDEAVRTLSNWENEVGSIRHLEETEKSATKEALSHHVDDKISASARLNLVADLKKIKKFIDPEDHITPRIMISEFERYISSKNQIPGQEMTPEMTTTTPKRVQFDTPPNEEAGVVYYPRRPTGVVVAKPAPTSRARQDLDLRLQRPGALTEYRGDKATTSGRQSGGEESGAKLAGPNTEWWRRKIRQGMMQTEMLMSELVRQRREDEKYFHGVDTYLHGLEMYHPHQQRPLSSRHPHPLPPAVLAEQSRLHTSLQESRRRHEACFGSCPTSRTKTVQQEEVPPTEKKHLVHTASGRDDDDDDDDDDDESITSAAELRLRSESRQVKNPKIVTSGGGNNDVKVIFERNFRTSHDNNMGAHEDNHRHDVMITPENNPPPPQKSRVATKAQTLQAVQTSPAVMKNVSQYKPKPFIVVDAVKAKAQTATQKGRSPINPEWIERLVQAQKRHQNKDLVATKKRIETERNTTNELYYELRRNRSRLENEVNMEKRRMALNWKLLNQKKLHESDSSDSHHEDSAHGRGRSRHSAKSHQAKKYPTSRPATETYPPKLYYPDDQEDKHHDHSKKKGKMPKPAFPRWKETPKGLSDWLEDVVAKAKEHKDKEHNSSAEQDKYQPVKRRDHSGWAPLAKSMQF